MFLDVICVLIVIGHICYINMNSIQNFKNGNTLDYNNYNNKKSTRTIINIISLMALLHLSRIIQIILIAVLGISAFVTDGYIFFKNKTVNKDNPSLQKSYISYIKTEIIQICIAALIFSALIIIF